MESVPSRVDFDYESALTATEPIAVETVAAGHRHMLALTRAGALYLFGLRVWMKPALVRGDYGSMTGRKMVAVGAGKGWSAAVDEDGALWSWGSGSSGCLGHGGKRNEKEPKRVDGFGPGGRYGRALRLIGGMDKIVVITQM